MTCTNVGVKGHIKCKERERVRVCVFVCLNELIMTSQLYLSLL